MDETRLSHSQRKEIISNILTVMEIVPQEALELMKTELEQNRDISSLKLKQITGLSGQQLESMVLLLKNNEIGADTILLALDAAMSSAQRYQKSAETIDLSWTGPVQFSVQGRSTVSVVEEMIKSAKKSVKIVGYSLTEEAENIIRLLEGVMNDNVDVVIVIHSDDENKNLQTLAKIWSGKKKPAVYTRLPKTGDVYFKIHAKMIVVDSSDLLVTSANLTWHGMTNNLEVGLRVRGATAKKADNLVDDLIKSKYLKEAVW